ncbi:PREDICTED: transcription termination factor MTERF8, chloroplastic-like isoform X2 [Nelumbo nucifera]|uniref:Transcription termination factor MTERF8, chloroplastic-like isoform X2 n=1 Tax=Nelumbo nucifera TaxID=4432 RepID=A0A1U8Q3M5_NELNU|nr:PREDICTED: transcription termination factor MTERF8, chloroplastic-like isoform X2 [Nelumbo nucifera]
MGVGSCIGNSGLIQNRVKPDSLTCEDVSRLPSFPSIALHLYSQARLSTLLVFFSPQESCSWFHSVPSNFSNVWRLVSAFWLVSWNIYPFSISLLKMYRISQNRRTFYFHFLHNPFLKSLTTKIAAPAISLDPSLPFTVQYLVNTCLLSIESALSASKSIQLDERNTQKHDSVINFLKSHGFSDTHISKLITKRPSLLRCNLEGKFKPKIEYLLGFGFSSSTLADLLISNPNGLKSLDNVLKPNFEVLLTFLKTKEDVIKTVKRYPWLLSFDLKRNMQPNVAILTSHGVHIAHISKLISSQPMTVLQKVDKMIKIVQTVKKLGFQPSSSLFVHAVRAMSSMKEPTWERKMEVFKSLGWSEEEVMSAFKRAPFVITCSEEKIKRLMDFYTSTMKLDRSTIITNPILLGYGFCTRIWPRYSVLKVLETKKLLEVDRKHIWAFKLTEKNFVETYVTMYLDRVPDLMEVYKDAIAAKEACINVL